MKRVAGCNKQEWNKRSTSVRVATGSLFAEKGPTGRGGDSLGIESPGSQGLWQTGVGWVYWGGKVIPGTRAKRQAGEWQEYMAQNNTVPCKSQYLHYDWVPVRGVTSTYSVSEAHKGRFTLRTLSHLAASDSLLKHRWNPCSAHCEKYKGNKDSSSPLRNWHSAGTVCRRHWLSYLVHDWISGDGSEWVWICPGSIMENGEGESQQTAKSRVDPWSMQAARDFRTMTWAWEELGGA